MPLDLLWKDLVVATRNARKRPELALLVVLTLAVGLGINAAIFALVDAILLRPLPYRQPGRLVFLWQTLPQHNVFDVEVTPADYTAWHELESFSALGLIAADSHTIAGDIEPERIRGARVSASLMPLLGIRPAAGRLFVPAEDESDAGPVAMLSDGLWRRRYGADPTIIGRAVLIDGRSHVVIGILPPSATLPGSLAPYSDLWLPARMTPEERLNETSHNYTVIGRLADGASVAQATRELSLYPTASSFRRSAASEPMGARAVPLAEATVAQIRPALVALLAGMAVLLLAATANVATLLLMRAVGAAREAAIRTALGATRIQLMRHALVEAGSLSMLGAAGALAVASALLRLLLPLFRGSLPHTAVPPQIDARVSAATLGLGVLVGAAFGALAVLRTNGGSPAAALGAGSRVSSSPVTSRIRRVLVVAQIAFAAVLLGVAGLLVHSVERLGAVSPGFAADHLLTFRIALDTASYTSPEKRAAFAAALSAEIRSRPGVSMAAVTSRIPLGGARGASLVDIEGRIPAPGELTIIDQRHVTPDYFRAMRIPLLAGRAFASSDAPTAEPVAIVNRTMAERYWPGSSPIDRRVRISGGFDSGQWFRIVGVVDSVHHVGLDRAPVPEMYRPYAQAPATDFSVVVRTTSAPATAAGASRAAVQALDRNLPIYDLRTMDDRLAASMARAHATAVLLAVTALLAALLSGIAIYGSNWYSVAQRAHEIGIRLALGASRRSIFAGIISGAMKLTVVGSMIGAAGLLAARPLFAGLLFDTSTTDPATLAGVVVFVVALTLAATARPARRAVSVDPMTALRDE